MNLTNHNKVVYFNKTHGEEIFKNKGQVVSINKFYWKAIDEHMLVNGVQAFKGKQLDVLRYIVYNTCVTGLQTISMERIIEKSNASRSTVVRAVKKAQESGILTVGYLNDGQKGHYVFALSLHTNHQLIMRDVFGVMEEEAQDPVEESSEVVADETSNDTSTETTDDTSSKSQNPCNHWGEGAKKVPTIFTASTAFSFETYVSTLSAQQEGFSRAIKNRSRVLQVYKEHADEIAKAMPSEVSTYELDAFMNLLDDQMTRCHPRQNVVGYFLTMLVKEVEDLIHKEEMDALVQESQTLPHSDFALFNWVEKEKAQGHQL